MRAARRPATGSGGGRGGTSGGSGGTGPRARRPRPRRRSPCPRRPRRGPRRRPSSARGAPTRRDLGRRGSAATAAPRASAAYSPTDSGSASGPFAPWPRTSIVSTWKPAAWSTCACGSVRSRADSQPWTSTTPGRRVGPGRDVPARAAAARRRRDLDVLERRARHVGRPGGRVAVRIPGPNAVDEREPVGERERQRRRARRRGPPGGRDGRGRHATGPAWRAHQRPRGRARDVKPPGCGRYTPGVPAKEPHAVLGVEPGASPDDIKAAWRGARAAPPPRPHRRRPRGRPACDAPDGRDQRAPTRR